VEGAPAATGGCVVPAAAVGGEVVS
jgi:hypothetical protein